MKNTYLCFDNMTWPNPEAILEIEYSLRYGDPSKFRYIAASYVAAYKALFDMPQELRNKRIDGIKKELLKASAE